MFRAYNSSQIHQTSVIIKARDTLYRHICVAENYNWDINSTNIKKIVEMAQEHVNYCLGRCRFNF